LPVHQEPDAPAAASGQLKTASNYKVDYTWREMLKDPNFLPPLGWFLLRAMAASLIIGHLAKIVSVQSNNVIQIGFSLLPFLRSSMPESPCCWSDV